MCPGISNRARGLKPFSLVAQALGVQIFTFFQIMVSPAPASFIDQWTETFMTECEKLNCRFDYLAVHNYGRAYDGQETGGGWSVNHLMDKLEEYR